MKKAKVILAAIGVFAVVGGALAFKANRINSLPVFQYTLNAEGTPVCTLATVIPHATTVGTPLNLTATSYTLVSKSEGVESPADCVVTYRFDQ